jgi:hypothetical protein
MANAAILLDVYQGYPSYEGDLAGMVVRSPASEHLGTTRPGEVAGLRVSTNARRWNARDSRLEACEAELESNHKAKLF